MKYVNCARHDGEQNLVLVQEGLDVFYEVSKDIYEGTELLIWYGDTYLKYMGIPITMKTKIVTITNNLEGASVFWTLIFFISVNVHLRVLTPFLISFTFRLLARPFILVFHLYPSLWLTY